MHPLVQHGDDADVAVREAAPIDEMPLVAEEITFHTEGSGNGLGRGLVRLNALEGHEQSADVMLGLFSR